MASDADREMHAARSREARESVNRRVHDNMVGEYARLIPIVKYKKGDKDIDEFG